MEETNQPQQINTETQSDLKLIISILFYFAEPVSIKKLAQMFSVSEEVIREKIPELTKKAEDGGLSIISHDGSLQLLASPQASALIEQIRKEEINKELSKSALETLSIILYKDNVSRQDIDFIRGVNSSFILRTLQIRGLVVRKPHPTDARTFIYTASHELLAYLGISQIQDLPDFQKVQKLLEEKVHNLEQAQESND